MNSNLLLSSLLEIGLSELEAKVYLALMNSKVRTVSKICETHDINRMKAYKILETLKGFGLIFKENDFSGKIEVETPAKVISMLRQRENQAKNLVSSLTESLPDILSHFYNENRKPYTRVFQGEIQLRLIFDEILDEAKAGDELLSFSEGEDFYSIIRPIYFKDWIKRRIKKGVLARVIATPDNRLIKEEILKDSISLRQTKIFPENSKSVPGSVTVTKNKVIMWDTKLVEAIVVDSLSVSAFYKNLFETVWGIL